ncbi:MAG: hypothetical protein JRD89_01900 [Deltaproteobacteria bacterium]|nr:hypothetical protein [Deltaproteobacteria bacterium]
MKKQLKPGTPSYRIEKLARYTENHFDHNPLSSDGFETTLLDGIEQLQTDLKIAQDAAKGWSHTAIERANKIEQLQTDLNKAKEIISGAQAHSYGPYSDKGLLDRVRTRTTHTRNHQHHNRPTKRPIPQRTRMVKTNQKNKMANPKHPPSSDLGIFFQSTTR